MRSPRDSVHEKHEKHESSAHRLRAFFLFVAFVLFVDPAPTRAAEPFFQKGDVIAIVGGEDMVALSEYGYLELLLTRALPDYHLRFRNLAWEGDTVFEQRRDLGFPTWEEQLEKIGATVVLCQFGQMESLAGREKLPEFIAAYEKLLARFSGGGKRRVFIFGPTWFDYLLPDQSGDNVVVEFYHHAILKMADKAHLSYLGPGGPIGFGEDVPAWRNGCHLNEVGQAHFAVNIKNAINAAEGWPKPYKERLFGRTVQDLRVKNSIYGDDEPLRQLIIAKNKLWFDYWRVQNWAFLAGDRTNQPSSRDHLDPQKRWFPEEREKFLPLIEAKEKEIDALATQLAQP